MKRASYREAVEWLSLNDDVSWLTDQAGRIDGEPTLSIPAALAADLFGVSAAKLAEDITRSRARLERETAQP